VAEIQKLKSQLQDAASQPLDLKEQLQKLTPQNSSLPPSSQHLHAQTKPFPLKANRNASEVGSQAILVACAS
jgi:hypothetical protein